MPRAPIRPDQLKGVSDAAVKTGTVAVRASGVVVTRTLTLYPLRILVPTAAFAVTLAVVVGFGVGGDLRFYQAAATIIVVLVLSLSTQGHFFLLETLPAPPDWVQRLGTGASRLWILSERFSAIGVLAYLGIGEGAALYAIATTTRAPLLLGLCAAAISSGFFAIGMLALLGDAAATAPGPDEELGEEERLTGDDAR